MLGRLSAQDRMAAQRSHHTQAAIAHSVKRQAGSGFGPCRRVRDLSHAGQGGLQPASRHRGLQNVSHNPTGFFDQRRIGIDVPFPPAPIA